MILTKDNILRFIKERKAVTPTIIAENFDTSTMIASAALSELAKDKLIGITEFKLSSSPYYYDLAQKEYLYELGLKHFSGYEKEILIKLKEQQVLNLNALSIQESLAIEKIKDFAKPLEIEHSGKILKFYIWYLRNFEETKKQIQEALSSSLNSEKNNVPNHKKIEQSVSNTQKQINKEDKKIQIDKINQFEKRDFYQNSNPVQLQEQLYSKQQSNYKQEYLKQETQKFEPKQIQQNQIENFIDNYFRQNYLQVESKTKDDKNIIYIVKLQINNLNVIFDCIYYNKKPTEFDIITFYSSSINPKIVFIENAAKKFFKLSENLKNLTIINI